MNYDIVQKSMEEYVQANWTLTDISFDNVAFNSDIYTEYLKCNVLFGDGLARAVNKGCYRQIGVLMLSIYTKPAIGSARKLELATAAAIMITKKVISPALPLTGPKVNLMVPDLNSDNKERNGWVQSQLSCPFYYDLEF
jgi:hypothetical protein